jgi:hypothetical protein
MALMPTYDCARSSDSAITKYMRLVNIQLRDGDFDVESSVAGSYRHRRDVTIDHYRKHAARANAREEFAAETSSGF